MFRNQYDSDVTVWSQHGRIFQIEYAMEAVKQGSASVGLKSKTHAVLATQKRSSSELGSHQEKIFAIDEHIGIAISGLTADARYISKFMRTESLSHKYVYGSPIQAQRLVSAVADKAQTNTQKGKRPYGVGLLVISYDKTGSHLYELCPSCNYYDYKAQAIGARNQSAKTYFEKTYNEYPDASLDELIRHALFALKETLGTQSEGLNQDNCSVAIVGLDTPFKILANQEVVPLLANLDQLADDN